MTSRGQHWPNSNSFYCWLMCCCTGCHGNTDMLTMPVGRQSQPTLPQHHTHLQAGEKMQLKHYRACRWREHERLWIGTKVKRNSQYKEKYTKKRLDDSRTFQSAWIAVLGNFHSGYQTSNWKRSKIYYFVIKRCWIDWCEKCNSELKRKEGKAKPSMQW